MHSHTLLYFHDAKKNGAFKKCRRSLSYVCLGREIRILNRQRVRELLDCIPGYLFLLSVCLTPKAEVFLCRFFDIIYVMCLGKTGFTVDHIKHTKDCSLSLLQAVKKMEMGVINK